MTIPVSAQEPNYFTLLRKEIVTALKAIPSCDPLISSLEEERLSVEPPREKAHGDVATNAALVFAKQAGCPPRKLATLLGESLEKLPYVDKVDVAGPGFVNLSLAPSFWQNCLTILLSTGPSYGEASFGAGKTINVEYVSTNPTGPMHIGHSRGAIVGDTLARLLQKVGYHVTKEFYVNDAGAQVQSLARSLYARYQEHFGQTPKDLGAYPGDYLIPVAQKLAAEEGDRWLGLPESDWLDYFQRFAVEEMMGLIRKDLALLGVHHDTITSERTLVEAGRVEQALDVLQKKGLIYEGVLAPPKGASEEDYEARSQTLFKSTDFGDDVDRPLQKKDGSWTYFASDIAYHYDKVTRGASHMINIWGADHGGYVKRLDAAVRAVTGRDNPLSVILCQMVKFLEKGHAVKMSKRTGTFISLSEVLEKVGRDALRFVMLTRKSDAPLDFDFAKVVAHAKENPVFYVQYASARCHSVLCHAQSVFPGVDFSAQGLSQLSFASLTDPEDLALVKLLATWPRHVEGAALAEEPHRIAYFMQEVAAAFHALWNRGKEATHLRFVHPDSVATTQQRLALLQGVLVVLASGLEVLGVTLTQEMR